MVVGLSPDDKMTRIGIFYDGGYLNEVSDYYRFGHERRTRVSVEGIHRFAKHKAAEVERIDEAFCRIVDAHYFRGRFSADDAEAANKLKPDRLFDDVLMRAGVVTHYLPRSPRGEKGIDVWLALEAFELAIYKRFNLLVLLASDGDYVPLVRKLNSLGTRVMLLAWEFAYIDEFGNHHDTKVSTNLIDEVTYLVWMHTLIDDRAQRENPVVQGLFQSRPGDDCFPAIDPLSLRSEVPAARPDEDEELVCRECGKSFAFSAGERAFFQSKGLQNKPGRCPDCRAKRRAEAAPVPSGE